MKLHNRCVSVKPLLDAWTPLPELWDWEILCNGLDVQCQYTDCNLCYIEVASCLFVNPPLPTWLWPSTLSGCLGSLGVHQLSMVNSMTSWNPQSLIYGPIHDYLHPMDQDVSDPHPGEILKTTEYIFFEAPLLIDSFFSILSMRNVSRLHLLNFPAAFHLSHFSSTLLALFSCKTTLVFWQLVQTKHFEAYMFQLKWLLCLY